MSPYLRLCQEVFEASQVVVVDAVGGGQVQAALRVYPCVLQGDADACAVCVFERREGVAQLRPDVGGECFGVYGEVQFL